MATCKQCGKEIKLEGKWIKISEYLTDDEMEGRDSEDSKSTNYNFERDFSEAVSARLCTWYCVAELVKKMITQRLHQARTGTLGGLVPAYPWNARSADLPDRPTRSTQLTPDDVKTRLLRIYEQHSSANPESLHYDEDNLMLDLLREIAKGRRDSKALAAAFVDNYQTRWYA